MRVRKNNGDESMCELLSLVEVLRSVPQDVQEKLCIDIAVEQTLGSNRKRCGAFCNGFLSNKKRLPSPDPVSQDGCSSQMAAL